MLKLYACDNSEQFNLLNTLEGKSRILSDHSKFPNEIKGLCQEVLNLSVTESVVFIVTRYETAKYIDLLATEQHKIEWFVFRTEVHDKDEEGDAVIFYETSSFPVMVNTYSDYFIRTEVSDIYSDLIDIEVKRNFNK